MSRPGICRRLSKSAPWWPRRYSRYKANAEGQVSQVYPALARVPSDLFGICVVGTSGNVYAVGDTDHAFSVMSVLQALRVRARLSIDRLGAGPGKDRGEQHRAAVQFARGHRRECRRADESDGECRGDRNDKSFPAPPARPGGGSFMTAGHGAGRALDEQVPGEPPPLDSAGNRQVAASGLGRLLVGSTDGRQRAGFRGAWT